MRGKAGISAIVATVLIILITVASVTIVWVAVIPMIKTNLEMGTACLEADVIIDSSSGYTCYDAEKKILAVQVKKGPNEVDIAEVELLLSSGGTSNKKSMVFDLGTNDGKVFYFLVDENVDEVSIAPVIRIGNSEKICDITARVNLKSCSLGEEVFEIVVSDRSCLGLYNGGERVNGFYIIDPDGSGGEDAFEVYCDMTTDGGGWTRIDYLIDLPHINQFGNIPDAWKWLTSDFSLVLSKSQIDAIRAISSDGKQIYVSTCDGVLTYHNTYDGADNYNFAFGFRFLDNSETVFGQQNYVGSDITIPIDECKTNVGVNLETIFEIKDIRVPVINVYSRDNGASSEKFGSVLTANPAWLR